VEAFIRLGRAAEAPAAAPRMELFLTRCADLAA
jgi:hypothetical protein